MMEYAKFLFILELIGTIAFASSGALIAIRKNMDIFGVTVLGVTTAVGGGCIRDLILGIHPPKMFQSPVYAIAATFVSCCLFFLIYHRKELLESHFMSFYEHSMNVLDAIGLGIFTVTGIRTACEAHPEGGAFLMLFVGAVTGIGGGMLRDIMAGMTPFVFVKHVYACASLMGAALYLLLLPRVPQIPAILISVALVIAIRLLAAHYRWNLPRIREEK